MLQLGNLCDDSSNARAGGGVLSPCHTKWGGIRSGAPHGGRETEAMGRETEARGRETEASGFPAKVASEHFCPDAPGDEGDDDEMPPLNNMDSSDNEADNEWGGGQHNSSALHLQQHRPQGNADVLLKASRDGRRRRLIKRPNGGTRPHLFLGESAVFGAGHSEC